MPQGSPSNYLMLTVLDTEGTIHSTPLSLLKPASSSLVSLVPWRAVTFRSPWPSCPQCGRKSLPWGSCALAAEKSNVSLMTEAVQRTTQELVAALSRRQGWWCREKRHRSRKVEKSRKDGQQGVPCKSPVPTVSDCPVDGTTEPPFAQALSCALCKFVPPN